MREHIYGIIDIQMEMLKDRLEINNLTLELSQSARDFLVDKGFDEKFGARPLRRALQKYIEDELAEAMLMGNINNGSTITGDYDEEKKKIVYDITEGTPQIDEKKLDKPIVKVDEEKSEEDKAVDEEEEIEEETDK